MEGTGFTQLFADILTKGCSPPSLSELRQDVGPQSTPPRHAPSPQKDVQRLTSSFESLLGMGSAYWKDEEGLRNEDMPTRNFASLFDSNS